MAGFVAALLCAGYAIPSAIPTAAEGGARQATIKLITPRAVLIDASATNELPVEISAAKALPPQAYLLARGVPAALAVRSAHPVGAGAWAIPLSVLPMVHIEAARAADRQQTLAYGAVAVTLALVTLDGALLAKSEIDLIVAPRDLVLGPLATEPAATAAKEQAVPPQVPYYGAAAGALTAPSPKRASRPDIR